MKNVVELFVYKGKQLAYDANGKILNVNQKVTLSYGTYEYPKHINNLHISGFAKVELKALYCDDKEVKEFKLNDGKETVSFDDVANEIKVILSKETNKSLTPEQKQIAELTARLDAYTNQATDVKTEPSPELKEARAEYEKIAGKKGSPKWSIEEVLAKTEELKNKN